MIRAECLHNNPPSKEAHLLCLQEAVQADAEIIGQTSRVICLLPVHDNLLLICPVWHAGQKHNRSHWNVLFTNDVTQRQSLVQVEYQYNWIQLIPTTEVVICETISCQLHFYCFTLIFFFSLKSLSIFLQLSTHNNQHERRSKSHSVFSSAFSYFTIQVTHRLPTLLSKFHGLYAAWKQDLQARAQPVLKLWCNVDTNIWSWYSFTHRICT